MTRQITLCAVPYEVTLADGQVIFEEKAGFFGIRSQFTVEWKGLGWYLVDVDDSFDRLFLPHLVEAQSWLLSNFEVTWTGGTGTVALKV